MEQQNYEIDKIDHIDKQILAILIKDAKMPYTKIGEMVRVSPGTVHVRMKKLEEMGIVKGYHLRTDYRRLGFDVIAYLGIYLERSSMYTSAVKQMKMIPEVITLNYTTGTYSLFAKLVCRDTRHLKEVLHDKIQSVEGIQRTETFIVLEESFTRPIELLK